jgi:hypothetical protein
VLFLKINLKNSSSVRAPNKLFLGKLKKITLYKSGFHGFFKADRPKPLVSQVGWFGTTGCTGFIGFVCQPPPCAFHLSPELSGELEAPAPGSSSPAPSGPGGRCC